MPVIQVTLIEGYDKTTRQRLCTRLTDAAMATIATPADAVTVYVNEVAPAGYMRGRLAKTPGPAPRPPAELCLDFLDRLGARDLSGAQALIAQDFRMVFPGGQTFTEFGALLDWAAPRYRKIAKTIDRVEEAPLGECVAVYISGTLNGERPDGSAFSDVRFVDRFSVRAEMIETQDVWNDLAESGVLGAT
jgi:phenylpyruvate tautomerase PptA (4-oxalocrotonate tautomerase family)